MSTPRSLDLPDQVRPVTIRGHRGSFAALEAQPATGVCERRPALLIPGFTGSKEDFIPVLQPLASAGRRVVAIDMRGQYQSRGAMSASGYAPDQLAADITAIIDALAGDGRGEPGRELATTAETPGAVTDQAASRRRRPSRRRGRRGGAAGQATGASPTAPPGDEA